jgi:hypothetical protein
MKIPILYIPKTRFKKYLSVEKTFKSKKPIIPIGCDCHPAYTLQKLHIRQDSLPFDWLNTDPIQGLKYVSNNLATSFDGFISGLYKNKRGHIVANKYPYAEFVHEQNLIESKLDREKFGRRINRLAKLKDKACYYLYTIPSFSLKSETQVLEFYKSVREFASHLKSHQNLCIYIRYDESLNEQKNNCEMLLELLRKTKNVNSSNYIRKKSKQGIWGDKNEYPRLYKSLGIEISLGIPKVKIT